MNIKQMNASMRRLERMRESIKKAERIYIRKDNAAADAHERYTNLRQAYETLCVEEALEIDRLTEEANKRKKSA